MFPEQSIIGARASVMIYDENLKKWIPSGNSSGLSKVQIFHHIQNNTFRVVGRKLQDHEVVINCSIVKGLKYNQATATFHQWRDSKYVYGLNFSSQQDAENFARAMMHTLEVLCGRAVAVPPNSQQTSQPQNQQQQQQQNLSYDEDMGYRTMTREDADIVLNQQQQQTQILSPQTPTSQTIQQQQQQNIQGHHRASSAPQAPQMPTMSVMPQQQTMQNYPQQYPIYATGQPQMNQVNQMNLQQQPQNGQIYVPSSISIQNSLNNAANVPKQAPIPPMMPPQVNNNSNNPYAHGNQMIQQQQQPIQQQQQIIPPAPQYVPQLQTQTSVPAAPPPPPPSGFGNPIPPCPPPAPMMQQTNIAQVAPNNANVTNIANGGSAPPPPPPMPMNNSKPGMDMGSLAAQLQQAKLRRTNAPPSSQPNENSGNSTSSSGSGGAGNYGTIGRTGGGGEMASMMDEMAKTLARRRERQKDTSTQDVDSDKWEKSNTLPHKLSSSNSQTLPSSSSSNAASSLADSPQSRKRFGSASEETILKQVNGGDNFSLPPSFDMKAFKADILKEMRSEITKAKNEIIDAIKVELNRRR
ncbi:protein enabled [Chironomus tepperi]|uniref:protein enabled n=1 Tax=Chironomus tepperi TaxID=113505 RepID=UPI00391FA944